MSDMLRSALDSLLASWAWQDRAVDALECYAAGAVR